MFYSHDTFGLGHLRRTLALVNHFENAAPGLSQLVISGSPVAHRFRLPENVDVIKLPSVTKNATGEYVARSLNIGVDHLRDVRRDILVSAACHFQPDFFIVDHAPAGMKGEVVDALHHLRETYPETKLIVGLRDIMDDPATVRKQWARDGVYELLDHVYDLIMVYGDQALYDVVSEYGFSSQAAAKTRFVGYLGRDAGRSSSADIRASLNMQSDTLVLVMAGGGGDGWSLYDAVLRDFDGDHHGSNLDVLIVGGPLLSQGDRLAIQDRLGERRNIHYLDFTDDLTSYIGAADAVISMGGYNSVCEILSLGRPSIIVPRIHPRQEQVIRADVLGRAGLVQMVHPDDLTPMRLAHAVGDLLAQRATPRPTLELNGLRNVVQAVGSLWPQRCSATG